ncbi:nucleoside-diphosphate-sugar epimerase [Halarchaeum rubridurum]|uniref:Epimerase n=1 Tax=Halarchaeum rubridurum TaxID=489911 RepID=A0A830FQ67_9EURY|nr:NAD-dependent epimerase/dehydratase family protein [Halarchaeum rubridurum]MBP1955230.1 nucleoside-diphosphate-sugar epimerase [Halarchaeum rubridurum]GGM67960.1 epimerase [Halarchaeum rubridurum]
MDEALVVGGTRFIGRHTVEELLAHDYRVTVFNRGEHANPFAERDGVHHYEGDRANDRELLTAKREVEPEVVVDCAAYHPRDVRKATEIFADVGAYVYVSSGASYAADDVPKREGETPLRDCSADQAADDTDATYGNRKAEGDRMVFRAAERGVNAMAVRPTVVYGPHDYTERLDYWLHRVGTHDRVVVPGDGTNLWQRAYVEDVASALRIVAESGTPGEAYNVGDRNALTLADTVRAAADALDTDVELVRASDRELSTAGLDLGSFPLYRPAPHLLDTHKLAALGWSSTPVGEAMARTAADHRESDRTGTEHGPDRAAEETVLSVLDTI